MMWIKLLQVMRIGTTSKIHRNSMMRKSPWTMQWPQSDFNASSVAGKEEEDTSTLSGQLIKLLKKKERMSPH